jgi:glycosyltransferase involved in cell wall biosynthesis
MHIAFICNEYPPGPHGGIGTLTRTLARRMVAAGHRVTVIGTYAVPRSRPGDPRDRRDRRDRVEDDRGVQVIRLGSTVPVPGVRAVLDQRRLWRRLAELHRREPIDVVEGPEAAFWAAPRRRPFATIVRMHGGHRFFAEAEGRATAPVRSWVEARSVRRADDLVAVSAYVAGRTAELLGLGDRPVTVIPNAVDPDVFAPPPVPSGAPGPRGATVLFVGTVCEKKGIRELVEAFDTVVREVPDARLLVAGRDQVDPATGRSFTEGLRTMLSPATAEHVEFLGPVDHDRVAELIARADVCAMPSHMEAQGLVWLEALACGRALVASTAGPGPEVVEDGLSGLLVDPHDVGAIAAAVVALLEDPDRRRVLGAAGRTRVLERFSIDRLVDRNVEHYRQVLARAESDEPTESVCRHLAVVSHVVHHRWQGRVHAYTPYARELDLWASMVERLTVVAPVRDGEPPDDTSPLVARNVELAPQIEAGGDDRRAKVTQFVRLPSMFIGVDRAIRSADAVQVRCPGNLGLIGAVVAPLRSRRVMAKYAGQWLSFPGEPSAWGLQRAVLRSRWFRGPVLAYGPAPTDRPLVLAAFSTAVDAATLERAAAVAGARRRPPGPLRVLFVGRLTASKHVDAVIDAVQDLTGRGTDVTLRIVGDGPERASLEARAGRTPAPVTFVGAVDQQEVFAEYAAADVLVLASASEGWPKAIVEAMAFGVVCIGNDSGLVPTILGAGRGSTVAPGDGAAIARELGSLAGDETLLLQRSRAAAAWASCFSLEEFEAELRRVLARAWHDGSPLLHPPALRGSVPTAAAAEPLRVLQVVDSLAAGGAERVAVHLADELARAGHESSLVATRRAGPLAGEIDEAVWWRSLDRMGRLDPSAVVALRRIVRERRIDVVHAHSTSIFLVAASFAVGPRPAIVWHDHFPGAPHRDPRPLRAVSPRMDIAVAVSREIEAADRDRLRLGDRLVRVPNFSRLDADAVPATDLPGVAGARIVCVANLRPAKDQMTSVRAMAALADSHPEACLLLVGSDEGDYAERVRAEIERLGLGEQVILLGVRTDVASVLAACDIGVLSSLEEGTPLAVLEYGLAGLPVVATAVGELTDVLAGEPPSGRLVVPGDSAALAEELSALLDDPLERRRLGDRLHDRIERDHSRRGVLRQWEAVYRDAVARRLASSDAR